VKGHNVMPSIKQNKKMWSKTSKIQEFYLKPSSTNTTHWWSVSTTFA